MAKFFSNSSTKKIRKPTPEQVDLEKRINSLNIKSGRDLEKLYKKIAHIRSKIRTDHPEIKLPRSNKI